MATRGTKREHEPGKVNRPTSRYGKVVDAVLVREARHVHQHLHPTTASERVPSAREARSEGGQQLVEEARRGTSGC